MIPIDFSSKHHILLEDEEGLRVPMDEPYFRALKIAPDTWRVLSDGDYSYVIAGEDEAVVIDSGYGAGDIRAFCQTLTDKPIRNILNTHDHFDHTAGNAYFDRAFMAEETVPLATRPFPSFSGIDFPRDYPVKVLSDGDVYPLKGRELLVFKIPDHAAGSLAFLDRVARALFSGDEFMPHGKFLSGSVQRWVGYLEKLMDYRGEFDTLWAGGGRMDADYVDRYLACARLILDGCEGEPSKPMPFPNFSQTDEQGRTVWKRRLPHPGDGPKPNPEREPYLRRVEYAGVQTVYDLRNIYEGGK
jgi:glyoxylase-like metal-dependent hydrolase (beta-lactamase superfamily II)